MKASFSFSISQLLVRWAVLALGVLIATKLVSGIYCDTWQTLLVVVVLLSFLNALLKPLLMLIALPFIVLTLGLGVVVINAVLFYFVGHLVDGFHVASGWSAIGGALVVSLTNVLLGGLTRDKNPPNGGAGGGGNGGMFGGSRGKKSGPPPAQGPAAKDDVIDI